ncbi:hypothetical protein NE857_19405 [Nocardiopsis exhalans]|uniref:Uncharacterized protein n=1 Tax=Nocardiopsis exhalans TaxID=163604 RepID=A0ABY5D1W9_9ACTN|nr:hypothetical protein [Nocardiopsis exhalans]USY17508.1 hypothetical protein NE857_19405 [Nocardiopsis exhalans]
MMAPASEAFEQSPAPATGSATGPARPAGTAKSPTTQPFARTDHARLRLTFSHLRRLTDLRYETTHDRFEQSE